MHITDEKNQVREAMKERIKHLPEHQRAAESRSLSRRLLETIPQGSVICAYAAMRNEAQLDLFIDEVLQRGDTIYLPRFENNALVFRKCTDLNLLMKGQLGVREPPADAPLLPENLEELTVILPGVAFDRQGNRMGRGNGGYDRWITKYRAKHPNVRFIGAALESQVLDEIPVEPHDAKMDALVTARELIRINQ